jgi:hypothetical protein
VTTKVASGTIDYMSLVIREHYPLDFANGVGRQLSIVTEYMYHFFGKTETLHNWKAN